MSLWSKLVQKHEYSGMPIGNICFGIPTINRKDYLIEGLKIIDTHKGNLPLSNLIIIDNGNQDISPIIPAGLKDITTLFVEDTNLGVSGSWNKILKYAFEDFNCSHCCLLNDDIGLGPTWFNNYLRILEEHPQAFLLNSGYFWSCTTLTKACWDTIGKFDENFFPAYFEDNDYARRIKLYQTHVDDDTLYINDNGLNPEIQRNSQSISKDGSLNSGYAKNGAYFAEKWGGGVHDPKFLTPFNKGGETPWKL